MDFSADVVAETAKQENSEDGQGDDAKSIAGHTLYVNSCFYLHFMKPHLECHCNPGMT